MTKRLKPLEVSYDFVAVIDGLPADERKNWKTSDSLIHFLTENGIEQLLSLCNDKNMLLQSLEYFEKLAGNGKKFCLHIICHGNSEGIGLKATNERIKWKEFREKLSIINKLMNQSLIVNMTSCFGLHGIKIVDEHSTDYPFFGLIGPSQKIGVKRADRINKLFYSKQLEGKQVQEIVKEINKEIGTEQIYCISSEGYKAIKNYLHKNKNTV